jgi:hypothetical protein
MKERSYGGAGPIEILKGQYRTVAMALLAGLMYRTTGLVGCSISKGAETDPKPSRNISIPFGWI